MIKLQYYIYIYIYIYIYLSHWNYPKLINFHAMDDDFQAIVKLSCSSNTLILDKVWHVAFTFY